MRYWILFMQRYYGRKFAQNSQNSSVSYCRVLCTNVYITLSINSSFSKYRFLHKVLHANILQILCTKMWNTMLINILRFYCLRKFQYKYTIPTINVFKILAWFLYGFSTGYCSFFCYIYCRIFSCKDRSKSLPIACLKQSLLPEKDWKEQATAWNTNHRPKMYYFS